jgi:hypothetical protein
MAFNHGVEGSSPSALTKKHLILGALSACAIASTS